MWKGGALKKTTMVMFCSTALLRRAQKLCSLEHSIKERLAPSQGTWRRASSRTTKLYVASTEGSKVLFGHSTLALVRTSRQTTQVEHTMKSDGCVAGIEGYAQVPAHVQAP